MVAPSLMLVCCLLAQDAAVPPATIAQPPQAGSVTNPSSRRPRPAAVAIPAGGPPPAQRFNPPPVDPIPPDSANADQDGSPHPPAAQPPAALPPATLPPAQPGEQPTRVVDPNLPAGTRLEPTAVSHPPGSPGAVLSDALAIRAELEASGTPLRLLDVLARARDPRVRLPAIEAYWGVALSWISAHWQWSDYDCVVRMEAMSPAAADKSQQQTREAKFRARLAATSADWKQAELELTEAQQRLASLLRLAPNEPLPLASDLPHVGAYKTRFETLYSGQPAPERSLMINRTLPLRERELRMRAEAVAAAREALEAAEAGFQEGAVALETVFSCLDDQKSERQAFLTVVHRYNIDIAEYALATPVPAADDQTLAARLIKLRREDGWRWEPRDPAKPSAATGATTSPIAVVPNASESFEQPARHLQSAQPVADSQPATFDAPPAIQRGEE